MKGVTKMLYVKKDKLQQLIQIVFEKVGLTREDAKQASDIVIQADATGVETHGLARLPNYVMHYKVGAVNLHPNIRQVNSSENLIALDGDDATGLVVGPVALKRCIQATKKFGIAAVTVNNSNHFGCGNYYGWKFAEAGLIGIISTNTIPLMAPFGGKERMIGTNPITVAIPANDQDPIVLDMATSLVSYGKIQVAANAGEDIPSTWANDANGIPTTDAKKALDGTLQPLAGHKGYGLALIIDIFCSVLAQASYGPDIITMEDYSNLAPKPESIGHFMLGIDPSKFYPLIDFKKAVDQYIEVMKRSEKADGVEEIFVPGEIEFRRSRKYEETGIPVRPELEKRLIAMCNEIDINPKGCTSLKELLENLLN